MPDITVRNHAGREAVDLAGSRRPRIRMCCKYCLLAKEVEGVSLSEISICSAATYLRWDEDIVFVVS